MKLKTYKTLPRDYAQQYRDQIAVIGRRAQLRLLNSRVHIAGLGGIGVQIAVHLATAGIGYLTANDPQKLDVSNLSRWPIASPLEIGIAKTALLRNFLCSRSHLQFEAVDEPTESGAACWLLGSADLIVCASNTIPSKVAAVESALRHRKLLFDVGVSDGRRHVAGAIRILNGATQSGLACPVCLSSSRTIKRREGLLSCAVANTAALASYVVICKLIRDGDKGWQEANVLTIDFLSWKIESLIIRRRLNCPACSCGSAPPSAGNPQQF